MAFKEKIVTAAVFVSSLFGGGAKVAAAEKTDTTQETNIEVTVNQENDQKEETSNIYTGWSYEGEKTSNIQTGRQSDRTSSQSTNRQANRRGNKSNVGTGYQSNINTGQSNINTGSSNKNKGYTSNINTGGGYSSNPVKNRINNTKQALKNIRDRERREWEQEGANFVYQLDREYRRAREEAKQQKIATKKFHNGEGKEFQLIVSNALALKYQIDNGHEIRDRIPYNTRKAIQSHAISVGETYQNMLNKGINEDYIVQWKGDALQGVVYDSNGNIYEYKGQKYSINIDLIESMKITNNNYKIGGSNAYSYGNGSSGQRTSNIYTGR